jgi:hypothetical protein
VLDVAEDGQRALDQGLLQRDQDPLLRHIDAEDPAPDRLIRMEITQLVGTRVNTKEKNGPLGPKLPLSGFTHQFKHRRDIGALH